MKPVLGKVDKEEDKMKIHDHYFVQAVLSSKEIQDLIILNRLSKRIRGCEALEKILSSSGRIIEEGWPEKTVVFDLDNTVTYYTNDLSIIGDVKKGFREVVTFLKERGYKIGIFTARDNSIIPKLIKKLSKEELPIDFVQHNNTPDRGSSKPLAGVYVDDRAFRHSGDWIRDFPILRDRKSVV